MSIIICSSGLVSQSDTSIKLGSVLWFPVCLYVYVCDRQSKRHCYFCFHFAIAHIITAEKGSRWNGIVHFYPPRFTNPFPLYRACLFCRIPTKRDFLGVLSTASRSTTSSFVTQRVFPRNTLAHFVLLWSPILQQKVC